MKTKKFIALFVCCSLLLVSACGSTPPANNFMSVLPWTPYGISTAIGEEICEYSYSRYAGDEEDGTLITLPSSKLIYTLKEGYSFEMDNGSPKVVVDSNSTLLTMQLNASYRNDEDVHAIYRGKTESITSYSSFDRFYLTPKLSYRHAQTIEASHKLLLDYSAKKATLIDQLGEQSMSIKSGGYDNESVYYLLRGLNSISEGQSAVLPLVLAYDDFKHQNSSVKSKDIVQVTSVNLKEIEVNESIYGQFFDDYPAEYKLSCFETAVALNTQKSGTPTKLYFAKQKTRVSSIDMLYYEAKNVLIRFEYSIYGQLSGVLALDFTQVFQLTSYSNR